MQDSLSYRFVRPLLTPFASAAATGLRAVISKELDAARTRCPADGSDPPVEVVVWNGVPGVVDIRPQEEVDFLTWRSPLYVAPMTAGIADQFARLITGGQRVAVATDAEVINLILSTPLSHSLLREERAGGEWYTLDQSRQSRIQTFPGSAYEINRVGFPVDRARRSEIEIEMLDGQVHRPGDSTWELAKLYFQNAWSHAGVGNYHTWVHFGLPDAAAGTFENNVPAGSVLRQLMAPHLRFTMRIDHQALRIGKFSSNVHRSLKCRLNPWLSMPMTRDQFVGFAAEQVIDYYFHDEAEPSVIPRRFDLDKPFDRFLSAYFEKTREFVRRVAPFVEKDHYESWMTDLARFIPDVARATMEENLAHLIWQVSILHSSDHYGFSAVADLGIPRLRHRFASQEAQAAKDDPAGLVSPVDLYRWRNAVAIFASHLDLHPKFDNRTMHTSYGFEQPELVDAARAYRDGLREVDTEMIRLDNRICPLNVMLQSVCF